MTIFTSHPSHANLKKIGLKYCFHIKLAINRSLYLTDFDRAILINDKIFLPNSGMSLKEGEFNDSGQNYIIIEGIFEYNGVEKHYDLTNSMVKIYKYSPPQINHFISYKCSTYVKRDLDFTMYLTSNTDNYNQTILQSCSKNCRANFGDARRKVNKGF